MFFKVKVQSSNSTNLLTNWPTQQYSHNSCPMFFNVNDVVKLVITSDSE